MESKKRNREVLPFWVDTHLEILTPKIFASIQEILLFRFKFTSCYKHNLRYLKFIEGVFPAQLLRLNLIEAVLLFGQL